MKRRVHVAYVLALGVGTYEHGSRVGDCKGRARQASFILIWFQASGPDCSLLTDYAAAGKASARRSCNLPCRR
jgi:hypothetical protein